jgi:hypothetical protein
VSHHYSGPDYGFPLGDARLDLTDLYAFPSPGRGGRSILVMNVHPSEGVSPPGPTTDVPFTSLGRYEICVDTDGDAVADLVYRVCFSTFEAGVQTATLRRIEGRAAVEASEDGRTLFTEARVSTQREAQVSEQGDYRFFAGWRSDPFFFDTLGALNDMTFTGTDFFTGKDVCSIVLEVPSLDWGRGKVGLWARTLGWVGGRFVQAERGGRPSQAVFLTGDQKAAYFAASPADDASFVPVYAHSLEHIGGYAHDAALRVAASLLPDILHYDAEQPACYPGNGRALVDDVMDGFVSLITNGRMKGDDVGPHDDLIVEFPYLGPPHRDR